MYVEIGGICLINKIIGFRGQIFSQAMFNLGGGGGGGGSKCWHGGYISNSIVFIEI